MKPLLTIFATLSLIIPPLKTPVQGRGNLTPNYLKPITTAQQITIPIPPVQSEVVYIPPNPYIANCGDNFYANFIYMHESGCRTNASGSLTELGRACGIGQALPCSKLACSLYDYACQNLWFTSYAFATYGGWAKAYYFWINHNYW